MNEIKDPTKKQEKPKAQAFGINNELMVESKAATPAAIIAEENASE